MTYTTIEKSAKRVVETIRKPGKLATGDAIVMLVETVLDHYPQKTSQDIITLLQKSGFHSADGLKDFIETQMKIKKRHRQRHIGKTM